MSTPNPLPPPPVDPMAGGVPPMPDLDPATCMRLAEMLMQIAQANSGAMGPGGMPPGGGGLPPMGGPVGPPVGPMPGV